MGSNPGYILKPFLLYTEMLPIFFEIKSYLTVQCPLLSEKAFWTDIAIWPERAFWPETAFRQKWLYGQKYFAKFTMTFFA